MRRTQAICHNCQKHIIWKELKPHFKKQSQFIVKEPPLCCYRYICPFCKTKLDFNKDWVRQVWEDENPDVRTIRKL